MWKPKLPEGNTQPIFRLIVQAIADDISAGKLTAGTRLPPHRDLSDELLIARGTVARAYREAEALGLVRSQVGRGTEVVAPDAGERPYSSLLEAPTALSDLSTSLPISGIDPDPSDALHRLADRPDRNALFRYHTPFGTTRHRMAGLRWLRLLGIEAGVENVLLCAGAQHALFVVLSHLASRAGAIYVEELTYPGMHGIAEALRLPLVPVAMDSEGMSIPDLVRATRQRGPGVVYCMPTIHNPTGALMSEARRQALADTARKHDLFIVEDAANRMLVAHPPPPLTAYAPERAFLIASVSKVLSPGLRVAYVLAAERELPPLARLVWATQWMVSALGPEIVAMWLEDGTVERTLALKRREAARRQVIARKIFGDRHLAAHPSAMHAWLTLPPRWGAEDFAAAASAKQNIVVTPSSAFWFRKTPPPPAIRISLAGVDDARSLKRGLAALATLASGRPSAAR